MEERGFWTKYDKSGRVIKSTTRIYKDAKLIQYQGPEISYYHFRTPADMITLGELEQKNFKISKHKK